MTKGQRIMWEAVSPNVRTAINNAHTGGRSQVEGASLSMKDHASLESLGFTVTLHDRVSGQIVRINWDWNQPPAPLQGSRLWFTQTPYETI